MSQFVTVKNKVFRKFITRDTIHSAVQRIAGSINLDYADRNPLLLAVLNGAFIFAADLIRELTIPCQISFVKFSSYAGTESTENIHELIGLNEEISNRHIIVVEDIVDSGLTMDYLLTHLKTFHPLSVKLACFSLKPAACKKPLRIDYLGIEIPNAFVVGYGLDYDGYGRNLPELYKLEN
jgi:hypoxanthine phosphoribosyltransferase